MAIPVTHTITLFKISPEDVRTCPFVCRCSCQWEGRAHTRQVADKWVNSHAYAQTVRGNEVIIVLDPSLEPPKPVEVVEEKPSKVDDTHAETPAS